MTPTKKMIKAAIDGLHAEFIKEAVVPVQGGQIPPPAGNVSPPMPPGGDPSMAPPPGGMPPGAPPGMPPGMDPAMMGGMPPGAPMDPAMMGMPPGDPMAGGGMPMDPAMMGPPPEEAPPEDPAAAGDAAEGDAASAQNTETAQQSGDVLVPVKAMTDMVTRVIEATKGKRTADPKDPNSMAPGGAGAPPAGPLPGMDPAVSNIGGAPSDGGMALPGMAPPGAPKMGAERIAALQGIISRIDAHKRA